MLRGYVKCSGNDICEVVLVGDEREIHVNKNFPEWDNILDLINKGTTDPNINFNWKDWITKHDI